MDTTPLPNELVNVIEGNTDDPPLALSALGALRIWLDEMEADLVVKGRVEGLSWQVIATHLRRSKQAVWERYRDLDPRDSIDS